MHSVAEYANPTAGDIAIHKKPTRELEAKSPTPLTVDNVPYPVPRKFVGSISATAKLPSSASVMPIAIPASKKYSQIYHIIDIENKSYHGNSS